jgi:hypothetical protein
MMSIWSCHLVVFYTYGYCFQSSIHLKKIGYFSKNDCYTNSHERLKTIICGSSSIDRPTLWHVWFPGFTLDDLFGS